MRSLVVAAAALALATGAAACGDDEEDGAVSTAVPEGTIDPAGVERKLTESILENPNFSDSDAVVECPPEPAEELVCEVTGSGGVEGEITATPNEEFDPGSFEYEGSLENEELGYPTEFTGIQTP